MQLFLTIEIESKKKKKNKQTNKQTTTTTLNRQKISNPRLTSKKRRRTQISLNWATGLYQRQKQKLIKMKFTPKMF